MPDREEVERLKREWLADSIWDLASTPGFEEYREELMAFEEAARGRWEQEKLAATGQLALDLGCPDNLNLARFVQHLLAMIDSLQERVTRLEKRG